MSDERVAWRGSQRGGTPWGWIVGIGCGAILLACIVFAIVLKPVVEQGMQVMQTITVCTGNLQSIGTAIERYRSEHSGQYPTSLEDLVPKYLADKSVLKCPADAPVQREVSYEYKLPPAGAPPETIVVKCDRHNMAGQSVHLVLRSDGKVVPTDERGVPLEEERKNGSR